MGLAPKLVSQVFETITEINRQGTTILLVAQNAAQPLQRAHRAYVIETGRVVIEGAAATLRASDEVRKAYLGED
jgi:branched-chain amino acid transport system ATP-binding protein